MERTSRYLYFICLESAEYVESETDPEVLTTDSMSFYDPRHRTLGGRVICPKDSLEIEMESFTLVSDFKEYHVLRHLYGIAEVNNISFIRVQMK